MRRGSALAAAILIALVVAIVWSGVFGDLDVAALRARIESAGGLAPLAFMGLVVAGFFVPVPQMILVALGGAMFGAAYGFVYGWVAGVAGTWLVFELVRRALAPYLRGPDAARLRRLRAIEERLTAHGFATVVTLRLLFLLAPPLSWGLAASPVRTRDFVLGTAVGIVPGVAVTAFFGDAVIEAGSMSALLSPRVAVSAALVAAILITGMLGGRRLFGATR